MLLNGDLATNDETYGGNFAVDTDGILPQQCRTYQAVATEKEKRWQRDYFLTNYTVFNIGVIFDY